MHWQQKENLAWPKVSINTLIIKF